MFLRGFLRCFLRGFMRAFLRTFLRTFLRAFLRGFLGGFLNGFLRGFLGGLLRTFLKVSWELSESFLGSPEGLLEVSKRSQSSPNWGPSDLIRLVNIRVGHYFGALAAVSEPQSEKSMYIQAKNEHRPASGTQPTSSC